MPDINTVQSWQGRTMVDRDGDRIGRVEAIYLDDETGQPEWALVYTGLFGTKATFVPLAQAQSMGDSVQVPYEKQQVKDAPTRQADGQLSQDEEAELYRHYGLDYTESRSEEELAVGTETRERGRARLRKYVTTEQQTVTVPVSREEVRVEREPVTDERQVSEEVRKEQIRVDDQDPLDRQDPR
jgi:sporulation protein YlmC with PRC-barrel domain